jgi:PAS domain-containing protein
VDHHSPADRSAHDAVGLLEGWAGWAPVASAVLDHELVCCWANPRFADLAGTTPCGARGRRLASLLRIGPDHLAGLDEVVTAGSEVRLTVVVPPAAVPTADGAQLQSERWRVHAFPVEHDGRALVGLVAVDVTDDAALDLREEVPPDGATALDGVVAGPSSL